MEDFKLAVSNDDDDDVYLDKNNKRGVLKEIYPLLVKRRTANKA
jgi:hypothetical protein